jgi:hypothetical protein
MYIALMTMAGMVMFTSIKDKEFSASSFKILLLLK